jgi:hypothetical protein
VSPGKTILLVFGILVLLGAVTLVFAGAALVWAYQASTDDEGFVSTRDVRIERDSRAVVAEPIDIDEDVLTVLDWIGMDTFRVTGTNHDPEKQIFMGIAGERDALDYLRNVDYDEMTRGRYRFSLDRVKFENNPGAREPAVPTSEAFWEAWAVSTSEDWTQTLEWQPEGGSHALVLMNADGSPGLDLTVALEVRIPPVVFGLGVALLVSAIAAIAIGAVMVVFAVRQP